MREYWIDPHYYSSPKCPVCGEECETIYVSKSNGEALGCNWCIEEVDSLVWDDENSGNEEALHGDEEFESQRELYFERKHEND